MNSLEDLELRALPEFDLNRSQPLPQFVQLNTVADFFENLGVPIVDERRLGVGAINVCGDSTITYTVRITGQFSTRGGLLSYGLSERGVEPGAGFIVPSQVKPDEIVVQVLKARQAGTNMKIDIWDNKIRIGDRVQGLELFPNVSTSFNGRLGIIKFLSKQTS